MMQDKREVPAELFSMMSGEFSSAEQAEQDSAFYNINLVMYPIWEKDETAKWLYVEQAVTKFIDKPYRQRIYRLTALQDNTIESKVYTLHNPENYIHGWNTPEIFDRINPDSLELREGCAVYLKKKDDCFTGSTHAKDCGSTLRGASYATSIVTVCKDGVESWDQGWNAEDEQVWGAEKSGYIFKRK